MSETDSHLEYLDSIAREAHAGDYRRVGVLSTGETLYVALASGRMRELAPGDSIPYAVRRVGSDWMAHMERVWGNWPQPPVVRTTDAIASASTYGLDPETAWSSHPAELAVFVAAALNGLHLQPMPGGYVAVFRRVGETVEPANGWATFDEVARLCGAAEGLTVRQACVRSGHEWPSEPEAFLRDFYAEPRPAADSALSLG